MTTRFKLKKIKYIISTHLNNTWFSHDDVFFYVKKYRWDNMFTHDEVVLILRNLANAGVLKAKPLNNNCKILQLYSLS